MNVPPSVPASANNPLLADALARAQALASSKPAAPKRPSEEDFEGPDLKKPFTNSQQQQYPMDAVAPGVGLGMSTEQVMVPDNMVGLIIGRGGEQITRLQADSGCKIQMSQDSQGMPHRLCTLTGSGEAISIARSMIDQIIANEGNKGPRAGMGSGGGFEMMVPGHLVARIIGKGGEVIKALQEETGAKIVIIQDTKEFADEKPLKITGTPEAVEFAKQRVEQVIEEEQQKADRGGGALRDFGGFRGGRGWDGGRGGGWPSSGGGGGYEESGFDVTEILCIPSSKVGLVMGKGGETIRAICAESGAHCQVDKNAPDGAREKNIVIKGRPDSVERAKDLINDKIGGGGYDRGGGGGGYPQQQPVYPSAQVGAQPDYSTQWAEYYRSLGMVKEAEIIEQQSQASAAPVQQQASDYSAQWAEYYRSMGKTKEAEDIEAQMRVKSVQPQFGAPGQPQYGAAVQFGQ